MHSRRSAGNSATTRRNRDSSRPCPSTAIASSQRCGSVEGQAIPPNLGPGASASWHRALLIGAAGTIGGGLSGFLGGLVYGFIGASQPFQPGMGAASVLVVILCLTVLVAVIGAAGVAFGIAAVAGTSQRLGARCIAGGALGGLLVGAAAKLLGLDAFSLLVGQSPGDITGAMEGLILGGAVGLAVWLRPAGARVAAAPGLPRYAERPPASSFHCWAGD